MTVLRRDISDVISDRDDAWRNALIWRRRYEQLDDAIDDLFLWEPGRKGWAAALRLFEHRRDEIDAMRFEQ